MNVLSGSFTPLLVFLTPKYRSAEVGSDASIESILIGMVDFWSVRFSIDIYDVSVQQIVFSEYFGTLLLFYRVFLAPLLIQSDE